MAAQDDNKANEFLNTQHYMVLAVVTPNGAPWAVPVRIQRREGNEFVELET